MSVDSSGQNTETLLRTLISRWDTSVEIASIAPLTPDASLRRYFRISSAAPLPLADGAATVVAMVFDSVHSPEAKGSSAVPSDEAYVALTHFFLKHGVAVPKLYADYRKESVLLIEDLGDRPLIEVARGIQAEECTRLYQAAIDQCIRIQNIPHEPSFFAYERAFTQEVYLKEMFEFRDYIMIPRGAAPEEIQHAEDRFRVLAEELDAFPKVLVHRDFHSWNLMVDYKQALRVIDFQDALMATRPYDLIGLVHDRDTDAALGQQRLELLLDHFFSYFSDRGVREQEYPRVLLQRDLKVAGRFAKLVGERGLMQYGVWIPGTLRRIGRTLAVLGREDKTWRSFQASLTQLVPELSADA